MRIKVLVAFFVLSATLFAQTPQVFISDNAYAVNKRSWYIGATGGMPYGWSNFSSLSDAKTYVGWTVGGFLGYQFNPVFSLEAFGKAGYVNLGPRGCQQLSIGIENGQFYYPECTSRCDGFNDLKSKVRLQQYGLRANINVLGFFPLTKYSRLSIDLSPAISAMGTKATIKRTQTNETLKSEDQNWHVALGGDIGINYLIGKHFVVGLYTGMEYLTGSKFDGLPKSHYKSNYIWESGIKIGWRFRARNKVSKVIAVQETIVPIEVVEEIPIEVVVVEPQQPKTNPQPQITFPVIYFPFNISIIEPEEIAKVKEIADILKQNPTINILIEGYADKVGTPYINELISTRRAEAVKAMLVKDGIGSSRISTIGKGVDENASSNHLARKAIVIKAL